MANEATTIGAKLRQARLNKNISLDELQQITKIQRRYLEAIENDDFDSLPGTFYVRAFVRQYAAAVGEDGDRLVAVLDGKTSLEPPVPKRAQPEPVRGSRKKMYNNETPPNPVIKMLPVIFFGLIAVGIVGGVAYMTWKEREDAPIIASPNSSITVEGTLDSSTKESSTQEPEKSTESSTKPQESTTESSKPKPVEKKMSVKLDSNTAELANFTLTDATDPIKLTFTGKPTGPCWIGVLVNNGYVYQYTLQAGETAETTLPAGANAATIVLGASSNLTIKANGAALDYADDSLALLKKNVNLTINYK